MIVGAIQARAPEQAMQRTGPAYQQTDSDSAEALERLGNFSEAAAHSRKAFAEDRLKQLREQLNKLMLFDMAPGALAGQSAQLARELKSAAGDFAESFKALAEHRPQASAGMSLAQQAYLGLDEPQELAAPAVSRSDVEAAAGFADTARQLAGLADKVESRLHPREGAAAYAKTARNDASAVVEMMAELNDTAIPRTYFW